MSTLQASQLHYLALRGIPITIIAYTLGLTVLRVALYLERNPCK